MSRTLVRVSGGSNSIAVGVPASGATLYSKDTSLGGDIYIGVPGPPTPVIPEEEMLDTEIDQSIVGVTYIGQAQPGTAKSAAAWRIKRVTESGAETSVDWAEGSAEFTHIWDDRAALSYGP